MKNIFILVFSALTTLSYGQDTTYYDQNDKKVSTLSEASTYVVSRRDESEKDRTKRTAYFKSGQIESERNYLTRIKGEVLDGKVKEWYEGGQLRREFDYTDGLLNGHLVTFWENGQLKRRDAFERGKLINGECFNAKGKKVGYYYYETMPEFRGGIKALQGFIAGELKYPSWSASRGIGGRVILSFVVGSDGRLHDVKVIKGVNEELDEEAVRMIKRMPKWKPGTQDGNAVNVKYSLPVAFSISSSGSPSY